MAEVSLTWRRVRVVSACWFAAFCSTVLGAEERRFGWSFDIGWSPEEAARYLAAEKAPSGSWLRIRGIGSAPTLEKDPGIERMRESLEQLRNAGYKLVALLMWDSEMWNGDVRRPSWPNQLPADLRMIEKRTYDLAITYGDLIDYWEIYNEPDISFIQENPETYAALLKSCAIAIRKANMARHNGGPWKVHDSGVMMAPLGLPPGPYLESFVANDGLSYTDAFNYHYYGYAEDFAGVYWQFCDAVREQSAARSMQAGRRVATAQSSGAAESVAVWTAGVFPNTDGWVRNASDLRVQSGSAAVGLPVRAYASEEPRLKREGGWYVTSGVKVEEDGEIWRFTITEWAQGPIKTWRAEFPLPSNWSGPNDALISFNYRSYSKPGGGVSVTDAMQAHDFTTPRMTAEDKRTDAPNYVRPYPVNLSKSASKSVTRGFERKELPIFLTEYGCGSLTCGDRDTTQGRERQRAWFASVHEQIHDLGIEGAMAFILTPCLERGIFEFGLLIPADRARTVAQAANAAFAQVQKESKTIASPALSDLLRDGEKSFAAQRWPVEAAKPSSVVIDFVPKAGLAIAKTYCGYILTRGFNRQKPATGAVVLYNFGNSAVNGELCLRGGAWRIAQGSSGEHWKSTNSASDASDEEIVGSASLSIGPGERIEIAVEVAPGVATFCRSAIMAEFWERRHEPTTAGSAHKDSVPEPRGERSKSSDGAGTKTPTSVPVIPYHPANLFECYFRTPNGNLYQTWPRLLAKWNWQSYMEQLGNFTMAFYGRAAAPWQFREQTGSSLVFAFHPEQLPAVYEIHRPQIVRFSASPASPDRP